MNEGYDVGCFDRVKDVFVEFVMDVASCIMEYNKKREQEHKRLEIESKQIFVNHTGLGVYQVLKRSYSESDLSSFESDPSDCNELSTGMRKREVNVSSTRLKAQ